VLEGSIVLLKLQSVSWLDTLHGGRLRGLLSHSSSSSSSRRFGSAVPKLKC